MFDERVADHHFHLNSEYQIRQQTLCQNDVMFLLVVLSHHASNFQLLTYIPLLQTFPSQSFSLSTRALLNSFHKDLHTRSAFSLFLQPLPHMSHVLYVLLANGILKNVKMDALFFPNGRHLPIGYITLANHGMSEYYLNSIHRKELLKLAE